MIVLWESTGFLIHAHLEEEKKDTFEVKERSII